MPNHNKTISTMLITSVGLGVCFLLAKYRKNLLRQLRIAADFRNPLRYQEVEVVTNAHQSKLVVNRLRLECAQYRVVGFDCEWVSVNGSRRPVALLQLASCTGLCALIRLSRMKNIPQELKELLEDKNIIKVGIVPITDAKYLAHDFNVQVKSTLDLRHITRARGWKSEGLAKLAKEHLKIELDKNWRISCSDWEQESLSDIQISYAAKDAHVAIELFKIFIRPNSTSFTIKHSNLEKSLLEYDRFLDVAFNQNLMSNSRNSSMQHKNMKEIKSRSFLTRAAPLYQNCILQAPDGEVLCTCERKKAEWYIKKNIAQFVSESPYTVRLKFEPAGRAVGDVGKFYQMEKFNRCVVCGRCDSYQRKHIVPSEYRKFFPTLMKDHTSHDILLLCPDCHQRSNILDLKLRTDLANMCDAPFQSKNERRRVVELPKLKQLASAAKALYTHSYKIPESRLKVLREEVLKHYPEGTIITQDLLKDASETQTCEINDDYVAHGDKVVQHFKESKQLGLMKLEQMWRQYFLDTMKPQFLPDLWSINHNVQRLEILAEENRLTAEDLKAVGIPVDTNLNT